jgi:hypothetical protein
MDFRVDSPALVRFPRPRSTGRAPARPGALNARAAGARAAVTLALGLYGLVDVVEDLAAPWAWLIQTLVLVALALGFLVAARRSHDHRVGWLLSGSLAAGLALAAFYNLVGAAATPGLPVAGLLVCVAVGLSVARVARVARRRAQGSRPSAATRSTAPRESDRSTCHFT